MTTNIYKHTHTHIQKQAKIKFNKKGGDLMDKEKIMNLVRELEYLIGVQMDHPEQIVSLRKKTNKKLKELYELLGI
jgi:hypothetical protein